MHSYLVEDNKDHIVYLIMATIALILSYLFNLFSLDWKWSFVISIPGVMTLFALIRFVFNHNLWKKILRPLSVPNLNGIWSCVISTGPESRYEATMTIKQTWRKISIELKTQDSRSYSTSAYFYSGSAKLLYNYRNEPSQDTVDTMHSHKGTCELLLESSGPSEGNYYNDKDRKTNGKVSDFRRK